MGIPNLPPEKSAFRLRSNSKNWTWNNGLIQNQKRSTSKLYIVTLFNFCANYIMQNAGLDEMQAGIKIAGRNIKTSDMHIKPPLWQKAKKN